MNDPWDVKIVRQSNQYLSCMKLNGVPLLPPVLSRECRKEMQYYKLLAKEVEKRISILHPYVNSDSDSCEDKTDGPELPEYEQNTEPHNKILLDNIEKTATKASDKNLESPPKFAKSCTESSEESLASNVTVKSTDTSLIDSPKLVIDLSFNNSQIGKNLIETVEIVSECNKTPSSPSLELPERDCDYENKPMKELLTDVETIVSYKKKNVLEDVVFNHKLDDNCLSDQFPDIPLRSDGPSSLSSRSFTGSLRDIHTESTKELDPKLIRQHSYTVLHPSPQLLAHLEVQSLNTGVEVTAISMSESLSNIHSPNKKRRSWDLESAKVKWSHMALELQRARIAGTVRTKTNVSNANSNNVNNNNGNANNKNGNNGQGNKQAWNKAPSKSPARAHSVAPEQNTRRSSLNAKTLPKSEPIQKPKTITITAKNIPSNRTIVKEPTYPKVVNQKRDSPKYTPPVISKSDDPATRVRELYEKIQKQQLIQMANLVEKQKREQLLLQQVFEEQNNLLFKQLKTICPKSPVEVKEAWCDKIEDRGPVSLSQLINTHQLSTPSICTDPVNTLSETNGYISRCDNVLKKSRDITNSINKQSPKSRSLNGSKIQTPQSQVNRTRTHSPTQRNTSRRLNYDSANSSDREYEPILTDRTNDTMADLNNITFPSDSDDCQVYLSPVTNPSNNGAKRNFVSVVHTPSFRSTDSAIRTLEDTIQNSMNTMNMICNNTIRMGKHDTSLRPPTTKELTAATRIVAHAKGYLVRRLMRTERVQQTVQTIRDALLCALQLHRDREGIRGADVDLHRRLIQQITAACYSLHDAFVASSPAERCALIAADRARRRATAARQPAPPARTVRRTDIMSQSCSGSLPARHHKRPSASLMTQSNYESYSAPSPRRRPWR